MDSAISAAFNPIALYGTYMRLLYCCNYFGLYASFLSPFILLYFLHFIPILSGPFPARPGRPGRKTFSWGADREACLPHKGCPFATALGLWELLWPATSGASWTGANWMDLS